MKFVSQKKELNIYRSFLINLHTAIWTGNYDKVNIMIKKLGEYSYARTNSNGDIKQENQEKIRTLLALET